MSSGLHTEDQARSGAPAGGKLARAGRRSRIVSRRWTVQDRKFEVAPVPEPGTSSHVVAPHDAPAPRRQWWMHRYQAALLAIDLTAASLAALFGLLVRFGDASPAMPRLAALAMPLMWVLVVGLNRAYEARYVGVGHAEFERIFRAFLHLTALVALVAYSVQADLARGFVVVALPAALVLDLAGRYAARKALHRLRARGRAVRTVLAIGDVDGVIPFAQAMARDRYAGLVVAGACLTGGATQLATDALEAAGLPFLGGVDAVVESVGVAGADTVAVVSSSHVGTERLRWIAWQLEGTNIDLIVAPGITEVAGRRLHIQPVAGLPLLHVERPTFRGMRRVLKGTLDRAAAGLALLVLSPLLAGLWVAIRVTSSGPALFRQTRIGRDGASFTMIKFRSMYTDAEERLADLVAHNVYGDGPLFKLRDDPRVTRIGRMLRHYSLDELPQLANILLGHMSLVGPRPPLPAEVARYGEDANRRLLVKPGLTGLWQISGRNDLSWEESIQLDLRYVENWSPALDLLILWKTAFAVIRGSGAY